MTHSKLVENKQYKESLLESAEMFKDISSSRNIAYSPGLITQRSFNGLKNIIAGAGVSRVVQGMLLEAAYRSEKVGANSADLCVLLATSLVELLEQKKVTIKDLNEEYQSLKKYLSEDTTITKEKLFDSIFSSTKSKKLSSMISEALELSGIEGKIYPVHTKSTTYSVELVRGCNFDVSSYSAMYGTDGKWEATNVKMFIVDGVIENEAEIYKVLMETIKEGSPIMFVARGYGEEVIATIGANVQRGIIKCLPIKIPYELESVNYIADIAVCSNSDIVTPLRGDMISGKKFEDLVSVDKIVSHPGRLMMINSGVNVNNHLNTLREKRDNQDIAKVSEILDQRIQNLSSRSVYIRLASRSEQEKAYELESVDYGLRTAKSSLEYGVIGIQEASKQFKLLESISHIKEERPRKSLLSALYHAIGISKVLCDIEKAIVIDI